MRMYLCASVSQSVQYRGAYLQSRICLLSLIHSSIQTRQTNKYLFVKHSTQNNKMLPMFCVSLSWLLLIQNTKQRKCIRRILNLGWIMQMIILHLRNYPMVGWKGTNHLDLDWFNKYIVHRLWHCLSPLMYWKMCIKKYI